MVTESGMLIVAFCFSTCINTLAVNFIICRISPDPRSPEFFLVCKFFKRKKTLEDKEKRHTGPEVLFKTCVTMKFVDDDDDDDLKGFPRVLKVLEFF